MYLMVDNMNFLKILFLNFAFIQLLLVFKEELIIKAIKFFNNQP